MRNALKRVIRSDAGQDLLEYGMLAALICVVTLVVVGSVGNVLNTVFWQFIATNVAANL